MNGRGALRPMTVADLPRTSELFNRMFRNRSSRFSESFSFYLHDLLFTNPFYSADGGSFVHQRRDGRVVSAFFSVPMQFVAQDRPISGRMVSAFMAERRLGSAGAVEIALKLRPTRQDFCFTDSASPITKAHFLAVGGATIPLQGLEWRRVYRPLAMAFRRLERKAPFVARLPASLLAAPVDALLRRHPRLVPPAPEGLRDEPMDQDAFIELAPKLVAHYAVRPAWSRPELEWLLRMASGNEKLGPLKIRAVFDGKGATIGCFVFYGGAGDVAQVLNVLAERGREADVTARMFRYFDEIGCAGAVGRAQAALMDGLSQQRALSFRQKAFVCVSTRHADVIDAVRRSDVYVGGLAGEGWSRLMSDFN